MRMCGREQYEFTEKRQKKVFKSKKLEEVTIKTISGCIIIIIFSTDEIEEFFLKCLLESLTTFPEI
jgi:hypothetical protein